MSEKQEYANITFQNDGRLKLLIIVGTRPGGVGSRRNIGSGTVFLPEAAG